MELAIIICLTLFNGIFRAKVNYLDLISFYFSRWYLRNLIPNGNFPEPSYGYLSLKRVPQSHRLSTLCQLRRTFVVYLVATKKLSLTNTQNVVWLRNGIATWWSVSLGKVSTLGVVALWGDLYWFNFYKSVDFLFYRFNEFQSKIFNFDEILFNKVIRILSSL